MATDTGHVDVMLPGRMYMRVRQGKLSAYVVELHPFGLSWPVNTPGMPEAIEHGLTIVYDWLIDASIAVMMAHEAHRRAL
jgi:hypothetical protein